MSTGLDSDQGQCFVNPDLGPNCLQTLPADKKKLLLKKYIIRPLDKTVKLKIIFHPKHMSWVLKKNVSMIRFFSAPKIFVQSDG